MTWSNPFAEEVALPVVQRIRIQRDTSRTNGSGYYIFRSDESHTYRVTLEFNRPVTQTGCRVQFWRYKRGMRSGGTHLSPVKVGFRAVDNNGGTGSNAGFPSVAVPVGSTSVSLGELRQLFRTPPVRNSSGSFSPGQGRWHNRPPGDPMPANVPVPQANQGTKVTLKFGIEWAHAIPGVGLRQDRGPMSVETLVIWLWFYRARGNPGFIWNLRAEVK